MDEDYVEGLTGDEIINDALDMVAAKLHQDCNLRSTDAYTGGYEGYIEVHLKLRGLDTAEVKSRIIVGAPLSVTSGTEPSPETEVETRVDIELEPRLNLVRERSGQDVPTLTKDDDGKTVVKKRHYAKPKPEPELTSTE